jgi:hypothetical protein
MQKENEMSEQTAGPKDIAFVVYSGLTPLDLVGPLQVITAMTPVYAGVPAGGRGRNSGPG